MSEALKRALEVNEAIASEANDGAPGPAGMRAVFDSLGLDFAAVEEISLNHVNNTMKTIAPLLPKAEIDPARAGLATGFLAGYVARAREESLS